MVLNVEQVGVSKEAAVTPMNPLTKRREWHRRQSHDGLTIDDSASKMRTGHLRNVILHITTVQRNPYSSRTFVLYQYCVNYYRKN